MNWFLDKFFKITISKINAHCDKCGYEENISNENIDELLHKKCPKCGTEMINENDIIEMKKLMKKYHREPIEKGHFSIPFTLRTKKHF